MAEHTDNPAKPMIVCAGGAKRPLGSLRQRDLVRASLQLCPDGRDTQRKAATER
jgi:hypothetical protein